MGESLFNFSPERFQSPLIITALVFTFLGFVLTIGSTKIAGLFIKEELKKMRLSLIIKVIGLAVVVAFAAVVIFSE